LLQELANAGPGAESGGGGHQHESLCAAVQASQAASHPVGSGDLNFCLLPMI
jgi:hypothetical protein